VSSSVLPPSAPTLSPLVVACLAATWLIWGSTYYAIKLALMSLPPFVQMGSRFVAAGLLLLAWTTWRRAPMPSRRQWVHAAIVGFLMLAGGMGGTAYAEQTVGSALVVAFIAVVPVLIALLWMIWGRFPTRREALGIGIALAGVLVLTQGAGFQSSGAGLAAIAIACVTWSVGSVLTQRTLALAPGAVGFASQMLCGGVALLALAALSGEWPATRQHWPPQPIAAGAWLYLVVAGSLLAFNAYMVLLDRVPPLLASSYCYVNPVIAMLLGTLAGGEVVSRREWGAAAVILIGVVIVLLGRRSSGTPSEARPTA
jgi:drug/metabolite transporter (DMT)-like permease